MRQAFGLLLVAGCAAVGPDYQRPEMPLPAEYPAAAEKAEPEIPAEWWKLYSGPELDALVAEGCCRRSPAGWALTPRGFKYSNVIGDLFQSPAVSRLEADYLPR